jgi:hypothetical protein
MTRCLCAIACTLLTCSALAEEPAAQDPLDRSEPDPVATSQGRDQDQNSANSICLLVEGAAKANALPVEFFARVIWQESRFRANEVGPQTRSGDRAEGIAQFMPRTAAERGVLDPFNPIEALPKSAEFLRELWQQFGNPGLAAAAYNAGPQRVRDWMAGRRVIPQETRNYVLAVTGRSIDDWATPNAVSGAAPPAVSDCRQLMALLKQRPNPFVIALTRRVERGTSRPWGVQLSAGFVRERALASYESLASRYADILAGSDPIIIQSTFRSRGARPFYQIRVGAETRASANTLCDRLLKAGGACLVLRNLAGPG